MHPFETSALLRPVSRAASRSAAGAIAAALMSGCLVTGAPVLAVVNTEALRVGADEAGWSGFFELTLAAVEGNSDALLVGSGFRLQLARLDEYLPPGEKVEPVEYTRQRVFLVANYTFAEQNDERSVNQGFGHLRWTRMRTYRLGHEVFAQLETDEFTRLDRRFLGGLGLRWAPVRGERSEVFVGSGYMYEGERLDVNEAGSDERRSRHHRWNNYLTLKREAADERFLVANTVYIQPRFDELDDFRIYEQVALEIKINETVALGLSLQVSHDNRPPAGVEKTDYSVRNSFRFEF